MLEKLILKQNLGKETLTEIRRFIPMFSSLLETISCWKLSSKIFALYI